MPAPRWKLWGVCDICAEGDRPQEGPVLESTIYIRTYAPPSSKTQKYVPLGTMDICKRCIRRALNARRMRKVRRRAAAPRAGVSPRAAGSARGSR